MLRRYNMREYILLQICNNNIKKPKEYDSFINQTFKMNDKLELNKPINMVFSEQTIKAKLEMVKKDDDTLKTFFIATDKFSCIVQLKEFYNQVTNK
jgi:hypothetical protein